MFLRAFLAQGRKLKLSDADLVATATAFTAASIADAYRRFVFPSIKSADLPKLQIILGGGGTKNPTLVRMLAERMDVGELCTHEDFGMNSSAKEPLAFAIMAHETLQGQPSNVPSVTGARRAVVLGKIVPC
jgi:anhydro-N-acetylmuramic acid kinase